MRSLSWSFSPTQTSSLCGGGPGDTLPTKPSAMTTRLAVVALYDTDEDKPNDPPLFIREDWIGRGLTWSTCLPNCVKRARNDARRIPDLVFSAMIPARTLTIQQILTRGIPGDMTSSLSSGAKFSFELPSLFMDGTVPDSMYTTTIAHLYSSLSSASNLRTLFDSAWLSGSQSVILPSDPHQKYPLWTERLLGEIDITKRKQKSWLDATLWITRVSKEDETCYELAKRCRSSWSSMPWDSMVPGFSEAVSLSTQALALLLSDNWLHDDIINAGLDFCMGQLDRSSRVRLVNCLFVEALCRTRMRGHYQPRTASALDVSIRCGEVEELFIPLHVHGNHWTLLQIHLVNRTYTYVDSRDCCARPPSETIEVLVWWLSQLLGSCMSNGNSDEHDHAITFTPEPYPFPTPTQHDTSSCGIVVLSTIAARLLGYEEWTQATYAAHRMQWYLRLSQTLHEEDMDSWSSELATLPEEELQLADSTQACSGPVDIRTVSDVDAAGHTCRRGMLALDQIPLADPPGSTLPQPPHRLQKRVRTLSSRERSDEVELGLLSGYDTDYGPPPKRGKAVQSRSWGYQKALREKVEIVGFSINVERQQAFQTKIRSEDPHSQFKQTDPLAVWCSACAEWLTMRLLYDTKNWKLHRKTNKCRRKQGSGASASTLTQFFRPIGTSIETRKVLPVSSYNSTATPTARLSSADTAMADSTAQCSLPCPGLQRKVYEKVDIYLRRTATPGGGAPSRQRIMKQLWPNNSDITWATLAANDRIIVLRREESLYRWRNSRGLGAVYSTRCESSVSVEDPSLPAVPCSSCAALLKFHIFLVQLNRPMPLEHNMKHVPKLWRCQELGEIYLRYNGVRQLIEEGSPESPWLKFVRGVLSGKYHDNEVLLGAIEAMVIKTERLGSGKSLKNMTYSRIFCDFTNILSSVSTLAYKTFRRHFGGPAVRSLQQMRARSPRFQPGVSSSNVIAIKAVLDKLNYHGPIAMAWDDTDLEPALAIWEESQAGIHSIVGSAAGTINVGPGEDLDKRFEEAKDALADKIRLFLIIVPLYKVPPMVLAAVARGSKEDANALSRMHSELTRLLHGVGIYPTSIAADGTEVERATQRVIAASADRILHYSIYNPVPTCVVNLEIPLFSGNPCVAVQDSKHALKTARNQLSTGARLLSLGNTAIYFQMLSEWAHHPLSPLFRRDVDKVSKQEDRAAARLFSAPAFSHLTKTFPGRQGLAVYLFVLGELVDAWQNRNISHIERARMVLRARFFLMAWRAHIVEHPDYALHVQFISRESYDIFITLCDSLLSLIVIYRKYFPTYPFLPWLHSTEACEHVFGLLRQLKKDFTYLDMLYLEPKLRTLLLGAFRDLTAEEKANHTAGGYYHSYFLASDLNLKVLAEWPSDKDLTCASECAYKEAEQLLAATGINGAKMLAQYTPPEPNKPSKLGTDSSNLNGPKPPQTLAELLTLYSRSAPLANLKQEDEFERYELALAAESVDQSMNIQQLPDASDECELPLVKTAIAEQLPSPLKSNAIDNRRENAKEPLLLFDIPSRTLSVDMLIRERERHQTIFAAKSVRQAVRGLGLNPSQQTRTISEPEQTCPTLRQELIKRLCAVVPENEHFNATSGVDRYVRHTGIFRGATLQNQWQKNKATLRSVNASKFIRHRATTFQPLSDVHENIFNANVHAANVLKNGDLVIVWHRPPGASRNPGGGLLVGEVITMYAKSEGHGAKHEWISSVDSIGVLSYVGVRVYRQMWGATHMSMSCTKLECETFLRIPRSQIVFSLSSCTIPISHNVINAGDGSAALSILTLCPFSSDLMASLGSRLPLIEAAVRNLNKLVRNQKATVSCAESKDGSGCEGESETGGD